MKKVLITGASRGFGKLTTELLVQRNYQVLAGVRGGPKRGCQIFSKKLLETGRLHVIDLHMDQKESILQVVPWIQKNWNAELDVLINNAGFGLMGPLEGQNEDQVRQQMEVNFFGPLSLTRSCLPFLKTTQGRIINISSIAGLVGFPFYGAYNASKFALEAISEAFYYELRDLGIQVALIEPGGFRTEFSESATFGPPGDERNVTKIESFKKKMNGRRKALSGDPSAVAQLIVALCEKSRIPLRTVIGKDAWSMTLVRRLLPDSWRVGLTARLFDRIFFKAD